MGSGARIRAAGAARGVGVVKRKPDPLPDVRVGHCAGCGDFPTTVYKVGTMHRYRCAPCYEKEVGIWPHLAPSKEDYNRMHGS